jgi:hypothetical protein
MTEGHQTDEMVVGRHPRVVHVHPGLTPLQARSLNLTAVSSALEQAGVDHFAVRGLDELVPVVGICEADRARAVTALHRLCQDHPAYVSVIQPRPPKRRPPLPGNAADTWSELGGAKVIRLAWYRTEPTRQLVCGPEHGCEVEFWHRDDQRRQLISPRRNQTAREIPADSAPVQAPGEHFTQLAAADRRDLPYVLTRPELLVKSEEDIQFPIDLVYTWVDGSDPQWQRRRAELTDQPYHPEAASAARYISRDELRFSLRSVHLFAPWVRNIYVVTADQVPSWLNVAAPNLRLVSHREIFSDTTALPTFNSRAIESQLHHIDGLAEHFLYLNDDMFFARPVVPQTFFLANGLSQFFLSKNRVPLGPASAEVTPVQAGAMNNRVLIERRFGRPVTRTLLHTPYALRRSIMAEIEQEFPEEIRATMMSRLRELHTITVTSSLYHYYAYYSGRAIPGGLRYGYTRLDAPDLADRLDRALYRRDFDTLCLNDSQSSEAEVETQNKILLPFLESYFPVPSPYEKVEGGGEE